MLTRQEALTQGLKKYYGKEHKCGTSEKYIKSRACVWCKNQVDDQKRETFQKWYKSLRLKALQHYSGSETPSCLCCGEAELGFLQIDHIRNGGTKHRKSLTVFLWRWLEKNNYPEGFRVLCANCNWGRSQNDGICPHMNPNVIMS